MSLIPFLAARRRAPSIAVVPPPAPAMPARARSLITIGEDIETMADEAISSLVRDERNDVDRYYQRGGRLVRIVATEDGTLSIRHACQASLTERLSATAAWIKLPRRRAVTPPKDVVAAVLVRGAWDGVRHLAGIVDAPVVRPDGSLLQTPGYDAATGLLYRPGTDYPTVPDAPTRDDAVAAATLLGEVIADFPMGEGDRSVWLAALLSYFARPYIRAATPHFVFDATTRGSGKGLAVDAAGIICTGHRIPTCTLPSSEEERRKKITSLLSSGRAIIHYDNVSEPLGGDSLESMATSTVWSDRRLGSNDAIELPNQTIVYYTGNNVAYRSDMARRCVPLRLVPDTEYPEERTGFRHADLLAWVTEHRPQFVGAALTILRAYIAAGRPDVGAARLGSYEAWSALVPHTVVWVGWADPLAARIGLEEKADPGKLALMHIAECWQSVFGQRGITAQRMLPLIERDADMREAFCALADTDRLTSRDIGSVLRAAKDRILGGRTIREAGKDHNVNLWRCEQSQP